MGSRPPATLSVTGGIGTESLGLGGGVGKSLNNEEANQETLTEPTDFRASHRVNKGSGWDEDGRRNEGRAEGTDRRTEVQAPLRGLVPGLQTESLVLKSCV